MAAQPDSEDAILDATLALAAERDWGRIGLADIAEWAGLPLGEVYRRFPSRPTIVVALMARVDRRMLEGVDPDDAGEPAHDRLLDALLSRLDALAPHKAAVRAMLKGVPRDPLSALATLPGLLRSMAWTLEAAGIASTGISGVIRAKLLALVYLDGLRTWLGDDSADMARTMAVLDRRLRQIGRLSGG